MGAEQVLDLPRAHVLALADDDVLLAPGDAEVAGFVDDAEVLGAEPAVGREGGGVERRIGVAEEAFGAPREDLALDARGYGGAVVVHQADLDRSDGPPLAVDASGGRI